MVAVDPRGWVCFSPLIELFTRSLIFSEIDEIACLEDVKKDWEQLQGVPEFFGVVPSLREMVVAVPVRTIRNEA
jgi:hypothetical protein